jgi:hypothetical protein
MAATLTPYPAFTKSSYETVFIPIGSWFSAILMKNFSIHRQIKAIGPFIYPICNPRLNFWERGMALTKPFWQRIRNDFRWPVFPRGSNRGTIFVK